MRICGAELKGSSSFHGLVGIGVYGDTELLRPVVTLKANTKVEKCLGTNGKDNPHIIESY